MKFELFRDIFHNSRLFNKGMHVHGDAAKDMADIYGPDAMKEVPDDAKSDLGPSVLISNESSLTDADTPEQARWIEENPVLVAGAHPSRPVEDKEQIRSMDKFDSSGDHNELAEPIKGIPAMHDAFDHPAGDVPSEALNAAQKKANLAAEESALPPPTVPEGAEAEAKLAEEK